MSRIMLMHVSKLVDGSHRVRKFVRFVLRKVGPNFDLVDSVQDATMFGSIDGVHKMVERTQTQAYMPSHFTSAHPGHDHEKFVALCNPPQTIRFSIGRFPIANARRVAKYLMSKFASSVFSVELMGHLQIEDIDSGLGLAEIVVFYPDNSDKQCNSELEISIAGAAIAYYDGITETTTEVPPPKKTRRFNIATVEHEYTAAIMEFLGDHFGGDLIKADIEISSEVAEEGTGEVTRIDVIVGEYDPEVYDMDFEQAIHDQVYGLISGINWITRGRTTH